MAAAAAAARVGALKPHDARSDPKTERTAEAGGGYESGMAGRCVAAAAVLPLTTGGAATAQAAGGDLEGDGAVRLNCSCLLTCMHQRWSLRALPSFSSMCDAGVEMEMGTWLSAKQAMSFSSTSSCCPQNGCQLQWSATREGSTTGVLSTTITFLSLLPSAHRLETQSNTMPQGMMGRHFPFASLHCSYPLVFYPPCCPQTGNSVQQHTIRNNRPAFSLCFFPFASLHHKYHILLSSIHLHCNQDGCSIQ